VWNGGGDPEVTSENSSVLPGHSIKLKIRSAGTPSNIAWTVSGQRFASYDPLTTPCSPVALTQLSSSSVSFFWTNSGSKSVSVSFKIGDEEHTLSCSFTVTKPSVSYNNTPPKPVMGIVKFLEIPNNSMRLVGNSLGYQGCDALVSVNSVTPFSEGEWAFLQIVTDTYKVRTPGGTTPICRGTVFSGEALDDRFPYLGVSDTGSGFHAFGDSPGLELGGGDTQLNIIDKFKLHVMFKPSDHDTPINQPSFWVSLSSTTWEFAACGKIVYQTPNIYDATVVNQTKGSTNWVDDVNLPQWSTKIQDVAITNVTCPSPC
jgi:hypothetical protein